MNSCPGLPHDVVVREVGLRDGLQSIAYTLPTAQKIQWLEQAFAAGVREIEVGAFVPVRYLPQLGDTAELVASARQIAGLRVSVLIPNLRGAQAAIDSGADSMILPLSASREHSLANLRKTPDDVILELKKIRALRDASGLSVQIEVGISTAFGCTLQGFVEPAEVLRLMQSALDAGADHVSLADTVGYGDPAAVKELFASAVGAAGDKVWAGHFHDTRGLALANIYAAMEVGIARFDASLAGIGGCPHAPGASGNVSTEDLAYMLASMGISTGLDLDALLALRERVAGWLSGAPLHGSIWRAG